MKPSIRSILYPVVLALVILLLLSSLPSLAMTRFVTGFSLIFHAVLAPLLAVCLAGMALLGAQDSRFHDEEWLWMIGKKPCTRSLTEIVRKLCFWLSMILAIPVILSITLNMFPLFDSNGQAVLILLHRVSVVCLTVTLLLHISFTLYGGKHEGN